MNYYCLQFTLNPKLRGSDRYVKNYKINIPNEKLFWEEPRFIGNINHEKIDFEPFLADLELFSSSKLNDLIIDSGPVTKKLIVSNKLKSILEKFRKSGMQFFNVKVFHKNNVFNNFWILNMYQTDMNFIDFGNSVFFETENVFKYKNEIKINSFEEFIMFKNDIENKGFPHGFIIDRIKLKENTTSDFFCLQYVEGGVKYIVSEKLKKEIEDCGCTGIEFMPIEMKMTEWLQGGEREKLYGKA